MRSISRSVCDPVPIKGEAMSSTAMRTCLHGVLVAFLAPLAFAASPPPLLNYQGVLRDSSNAPVPDGAYDMTFRFYDALTAGNLLLVDNHASGSAGQVVVTGGLFTAQLGGGSVTDGPGPGVFTSLAQLFRDVGALYLEVGIGTETLSPRIRLLSSGYALNADHLDGLDSALLAKIGSPNTFTASQTMQSGLSLGGSLTMAAGAAAGKVLTSDASGIGTWQPATGLTLPYYGTDATGLEAFRVDSHAANGYGITGTTQSSTGFGVVGYNYGSATRGILAPGSGTIYGPGAGVYGDGPDYGGYFRTTGLSGIGVRAENRQDSGVTTYAGYFTTGGLYGAGVYAAVTSENPAVGSSGVYGFAGPALAQNRGVLGETRSGVGGIGVHGLANPVGGSAYGVLGTKVGAGGYALFGQGDTGASGTKAFRIDHPDDPTHRYLLHYSAESPEVLNIYRGTVVLDAAGEALVELPSYFAKINKDPSYTLTAVGAPMPELHVAAEIDEAALIAGAKAEPGDEISCSFRIAGGVPGAKVSWRVEAVRNDRWVQARGATVEVDKPAEENGKYQHPELYGEPREMGCFHVPQEGLASSSRN
jgi:hypothetical protein